jgi:hypothetical protein
MLPLLKGEVSEAMRRQSRPFLDEDTSSAGSAMRSAGWAIFVSPLRFVFLFVVFVFEPSEQREEEEEARWCHLSHRHRCLENRRLSSQL